MALATAEVWCRARHVHQLRAELGGNKPARRKQRLQLRDDALRPLPAGCGFISTRIRRVLAWRCSTRSQLTRRNHRAYPDYDAPSTAARAVSAWNPSPWCLRTVSTRDPRRRHDGTPRRQRGLAARVRRRRPCLRHVRRVAPTRWRVWSRCRSARLRVSAGDVLAAINDRTAIVADDPTIDRPGHSAARPSCHRGLGGTRGVRGRGLCRLLRNHSIGDAGIRQILTSWLEGLLRKRTDLRACARGRVGSAVNTIASLRRVTPPQPQRVRGCALPPAFGDTGTTGGTVDQVAESKTLITRVSTGSASFTGRATPISFWPDRRGGARVAAAPRGARSARPRSLALSRLFRLPAHHRGSGAYPRASRDARYVL